MNSGSIAGWTTCFDERLPLIEGRVSRGECRELRILIDDRPVVVPVTRDSFFVIRQDGYVVGIAIDVVCEKVLFRYCWVRNGTSVRFPQRASPVTCVRFAKLGICL